VVKNDCELHHRRSIRLPGYDYAGTGAYFITICTHQRECLLGDVVDGEVRLSEFGSLVREEWLHSSEIRNEIELDAFTRMPNHIHGIVVIQRPVSSSAMGFVGAHGCAPIHRPPRSLGSFIAGFKATSTRSVNRLRQSPGVLLWQRNYYEHIIRNDEEWDSLREYTENNPRNWEQDAERWHGCDMLERAGGAQPCAPTVTAFANDLTGAHHYDDPE
jgi:putative transposase